MQNIAIKHQYRMQVNPVMASVREAEVEALRARVAELEQALMIARAEAFQLREKAQRLETYLYLLYQAVLSGEDEKAQEYAHWAREILREEDSYENA